MKILFVWTGISSFIVDCLRALSAGADVEVKTVFEDHPAAKGYDAERMLRGLDACVVPSGDCAAAMDRLAGWRPDAILAVGWHSRVVRFFVSGPVFRDVPKVCCFDMPWDGSFRRRIARWVLRPTLRHYVAAFVPGFATEEYARRLGFRRVRTGLLAVDTRKYALSAERRTGFLYMGRLAEEKRIDVLLRAYGRYRELGGTWNLDLYGVGAVPDVPVARDGWTVRPFVQPEDVPRVYAGHGCLVLASEYDPWPLVILQACANGMPVIASEGCANRRELVRGNGAVVRIGDAEAFARAMLDAEKGAFDGVAGRALAAPYDVSAWCEAVRAICEEIR